MVICDGSVGIHLYTVTYVTTLMSSDYTYNAYNTNYQLSRDIGWSASERVSRASRVDSPQLCYSTRLYQLRFSLTGAELPASGSSLQSVNNIFSHYHHHISQVEHITLLPTLHESCQLTIQRDKVGEATAATFNEPEKPGLAVS